MTLGPFKPNSAGTADPESYVLGRGILYLCELDADDLPDEDNSGWIDMGNVNEFSITPSSDFLEHFSSRTGLRQLDKKVVIEQKLDLAFKCQEFNEAIAAFFFSGAAAAYTNIAIAGFGEHVMITNVVLGRWYPIKDANGQRAYGIAPADLLLEKDDAMDVPLVEGTDYELDEDAGLVFFKSTAVNIATGDDVNCTLTANAMAEATRSIAIQTRDSVTLALRFIGDNPISNTKFELYLHKVTIAADGALNLITEGELAEMGFTGAAERAESVDVNEPVGYIRALPTEAAT